MSVQILAISGSLRTGSYNRAVLLAADRLAPPGVAVGVYDDLAVVPPFNEDLESGPAPPAVAGLRGALAAADAVLISTPEYNGSIPGQLKNALDWASRPRGAAVLAGIPVVTCSASPSPRGAAGAQVELRKVLERAGALVVGEELTVPAAYVRFDSAGNLTDPELARQLADRLDGLVETVGPSVANAGL